MYMNVLKNYYLTSNPIKIPDLSKGKPVTTSNITFLMNSKKIIKDSKIKLRRA